MATKLFVALDYPDAKSALSIYKKLKSLDVGFKVGLELFTAEGPDFVRKLVDGDTEIFLDLKFHDIPNTVAGAVRSVAELGVAFANIHIAGGEAMVRAAVKEKGMTKLLGVTVLTSVDDSVLFGVGIGNRASDWVLDLAKKGKAWGLDGVVCSPLEVAGVSKACGKGFVTMVPGIRPAGAAGDQKRVMTPSEAAGLGAHYIVVGRPITQAKDPVKAAKEILQEIR